MLKYNIVICKNYTINPAAGGIHHIFDGKAHFLEVHDESASVANQECLNGYMHMFTQATCTCVSSSGSDDCRQCSTKLYQMYCMFERLCNDMENKEGASRIRFSKPATINKKFSGIYRVSFQTSPNQIGVALVFVFLNCGIYF